MPESHNFTIASKILHGFLTYRELFNTYTRLTPAYFSQRNWQALQVNHRQRLRLYKDLLFPLAINCIEILDEKKSDREIWKIIKAEYFHNI